MCLYSEAFEKSYCMLLMVQGISLGTTFAIPLELSFFNKGTLGCILYSMYKMAVTMVTQLNEMRPLVVADCYK